MLAPQPTIAFVSNAVMFIQHVMTLETLESLDLAPNILPLYGEKKALVTCVEFSVNDSHPGPLLIDLRNYLVLNAS